MLRKALLIILLFLLHNRCYTQDDVRIPLPVNMEKGYPRLYLSQEDKPILESTIKSEPWAQEALQGIHDRIDVYADRYLQEPDWLVSRLQMYWKTRSTNIYVNGINYSHADGEAPVPTVRFVGSRDYTTPYGKPKLEDVMPYMDDPRGLYLPNKTKEGHPFEWVAPAKTGRVIYSINEEIIGIARDAAFLYWLESEERFAGLAYDVFHTYMEGMSYRSEPIDLLNGHIQTLVGFTNFQVIHEGVLRDLAVLYDFLHQYIEEKHPEHIDMYDTTIKRWTDQIIKNGVPQNNWNLHQAKVILKAAMVLKDNEHYEDGKGRLYYIDYILNESSTRQWSLTKFLDYGYDESNGVWAECPGYSKGVTKDLTNFIRDYDNSFNSNILPYASVLTKAVKMLPQYSFPNGQSVAFGDSYYEPIQVESMSDMIRIAQKNKLTELEKEFTGLYRLFAVEEKQSQRVRKPKSQISSFFTSKPLALNPGYEKAKIEDYRTQTFYAPNVSWHVQRIGEGRDGLMVSLNASLGNHMHANGINMELYGKGFVQGADPGKGAGYLQPIYLEYYSQFPAHNTVMVDGVSTYTEMLSYHAFDLLGQYPQSEKKDGFYADVTYSDVYFLEPETQSDQRRLVSIVKTGAHSGYYVDIFRSKKQKEGDKFHDYFYHNLGQTLDIRDVDGESLKLEPSDEMGFAGGHLYALDYMWDKKSIEIADDYQAEWKIDMPVEEEDVYMNLWMKGTEGREVFSIKSPPNKAFRKNHGLPYDVGTAPYLTLAARQHGEAWHHPFVSIYEPFTSREGKSIVEIKSFEDENGSLDFAGLKVVSKSGREDWIFSSTDDQPVQYNDVIAIADYILIGKEKNGDRVIFIGNGKELKVEDFVISCEQKGNVVLEKKDGKLFLHNEVPVVLTYKKIKKQFDVGDYRALE